METKDIIQDIKSNHSTSAEFNYWIRKENNTSSRFLIYDVNNVNDPIGHFDDMDPSDIVTYNDEAGSDISAIQYDIQKFRMFRPEWYACYPDGWMTENLVYSYKLILCGSILMRYSEYVESFKDVDQILDRYSKCIEWLDNTDFFTAPASTRYHDAYPSGLLAHHLNVAKHATNLICMPEFSTIDISSALLISLVHDWCKIGLYDTYMRNVKDESGTWQQVVAYKTKDDPMVNLGHGVSSMYLISKFFNLSHAELSAIRWHMGMWRCSDGDINELQYSNENYPEVHMLQFADQLSITKYA